LQFFFEAVTKFNEEAQKYVVIGELADTYCRLLTSVSIHPGLPRDILYCYTPKYKNCNWY